MASQAKINRVKALWLGLPETWRTELASGFHTFVPAFMSAMYVFYEAQPQGTPWSKDVLLALILGALGAGVRAGFKALSVWFFSQFLPDPKG